MLEILSYWSQVTASLWHGPEKQTTENAEANILIKKLLHIYAQLAARTDLRPCSEVNSLFSELVEVCTQTVSDRVTNLVLENPRIREIRVEFRRLCSQAECHLESYWSDRIAGDATSTEKEVSARLSEFPYFSNYVDLTRMELSAMCSAEQKPVKKIAFIGSGPLPLTSLCLTGTLSDRPSEINVLNIDNNAQAISESTCLYKRLGTKARGMEFKCGEAQSALDLGEFDAVYLAALVGSTQEEKEALLEQVTSRMRPGALLMIRSADRLRRLMYADFDPTTERVSKVLDVVLAVHPYNHIVNSIIIGKIKQ
ncbi:unnamed protein product [Blumeria hordei]|uniref:Nicotianamine synthase n=1 Tax=Blumeria hordei TaxID=2867405 RepID=A0A383UHY2_BLUHO|nr:unnamed protein product [Blumeria hordei]